MNFFSFKRELFCAKIIGIADKMKSVRLVQIFCPVKETNRTHSKGYVEDLSTMRGRKRYAKMAVLNLSELPIESSDKSRVFTK